MRKWAWPDIQDIVVETDSSPPRQRVRLCDSQGRKTTLPHVGERHLPVEPAETQLATLDDLTDLTAHHGIPKPEIKTASY
ncbi:hypothetical protein ACWDSL_23255 [Streptomyces sp. NPDC000941]